MHVQASVHTHTHKNSFTRIQIYLSKYLVFQSNISKQDWERGERLLLQKSKSFPFKTFFFFKLKIVPRGKTSAIDNNALKSNIHSTIFIQTHINNLSKKNLHTKTVCGSLHPSLAQTKKHYLYLTDTIFHMKALEIIELPKPFFFSRDAIYLI